MNRPTLLHWFIRRGTGPEAEPSARTASQDNEPARAFELSRRTFIGLGGAASLGLSALARAGGVERWLLAPGGARLLPAKVPPDFVKKVIRPADLLSFTLEFYNFRPALTAGGEYDLAPSDLNPAVRLPFLRRVPSTEPGVIKPAFLIIRFPPQHVAEQPHRTSDFAPVPCSPRQYSPPSNLRSQARIAGPSRLVFKIPNSEERIPLDLVAILLKCSGPDYLLNVKPLLPSSDLTRPLPLEQVAALYPLDQFYTALEIPYRLILTPSEGTMWEHQPQPVTLNERTELWHTRLKPVSNETPRVPGALPSPVRAVAVRHADDPDTGAFPFDGTYIPTSDHRKQLVGLMASGFAGMEARRLMLSSMGAWLDSRYAHELERHPHGEMGYSVEQWQHQTTMGRDQFVRVDEAGYLYPFGHRATWVQITKRVVSATEDNPDQNVTFLKREDYIVVRRPEVNYGEGDTGSELRAREIPFRSVRILDTQTPELDEPKSDDGSTNPPHGSNVKWFVPQITCKDFLFKIVAVDHKGETVSFEGVLVFIKLNAKQADYDAAAEAYRRVRDTGRAPTPAQRETPRLLRSGVELRGQEVGFARPAAGGGAEKDKTTALQTATLSFDRRDVSQDVALGDISAPFYPLMSSARVEVPSLKYLFEKGEGIDVKYNQLYVEEAFHAVKNKGEVFLDLVKSSALDFAKQGAEKAGALLTPDMSIVALSRRIGPVGGVSAGDIREKLDLNLPTNAELTQKVTKTAGEAKAALDQFAKGDFNPRDFFNGAKILGAIPLSDILPESLGGDQAPKLKTKMLFENGGDIPTAIEASFVWSTRLNKGENFSKLLYQTEGKTALLTVRVVTYIPLRDKNASGVETRRTVEATCTLTNFTVDLVGMITSLVKVKFNKLEYVTKTGQGSRVTPDIADIEFSNALKFVQQLSAALNPGKRNLPKIHLSSGGIGASYHFPFKTIPIGSILITDLSIGVGFTIPFKHDPISLTFFVGERENPFHVLYGVLGGGGFFALEINPHGIVGMEAAIEFGGSADLDIGVASGKVYIMAGIYFSVRKQCGTSVTKLAGYVRCGGMLSVLGLITVSQVFYLELLYDSRDNSLTGTATITVEIDILFFSISVNLTVSKRFTGSGEKKPDAFSCDGDQAAAVRPAPDYVEVASLDPAGLLAPPQPQPQPQPKTFSQLMNPDQWGTYCDAFAA